ncbi:uncharacterized protein AMSG_11781 [Thecamonas trahens ATCC 50062]|uniref:Uncharacterized protein n=1 Tax=Thecamonas trahens ATCC 50062 TaxID=461836 RepID=A0A0L0D5C9_THETB|nr:hypothetical protein AMSG_11781 [Thecamonas trahens ATCC 50062]KNC47286.1 hypothetical protein AMSG_11781 [Thecamonas trahens ATCC 50062]|eukprot:XP_013759770.1 hypothetical protein AMSG_11781 [Thecamonas trahens ATCC 50062]
MPAAYDAKDWIKLAVKVRSRDGSVLPVVFPKIALVFAICMVILIVNETMFYKGKAKTGLVMPDTAHTLLASTLGFLLVLRTNISLSRYREGRGHLGRTAHDLRNFSRQTAHYLGRVNEGAAARVCRYCKLFFSLTRMHLRKENDFDNPELLNPALYTREEINELRDLKRRPLKVLGWIDSFLRQLRDSNQITELEELHIDRHLESLTGVFAALVKVQTLQLPFPYAQLLWYFLALYVYTLPFVLVKFYGWYSPIPACFVALVLFGINSVGNELEDPFGDDVNDLEVDAIEQSVHDDIDWYLALGVADEGMPKTLPLIIKDLKKGGTRFANLDKPMPVELKSSEEGATDDFDGVIVGRPDDDGYHHQRVGHKLVDGEYKHIDDYGVDVGDKRARRKRRSKAKAKSKSKSKKPVKLDDVFATPQAEVARDASSKLEESSSTW